MSSNNLNTDPNILSLVDIKTEEFTSESPDSEELLIKTNNKGKIKESSDYESKPPILKEKGSNASLSFKLKSNADNQITCNVTSKGKNSQKLYSEPSSSVVSDMEGDPESLSITTSNITDNPDNNNNNTNNVNTTQHQSPTQSLRNKRFSYNSPSTSTSHQWSTVPSSSTINNLPTTTVPSNTVASTSSSTAPNTTTGTNGNGRPSLSSHPLSGSFAELLNLTNNAAQALAHNSTNANNNSTNNNENATSPSSRHGSLSSNLQQNFYRLGLSDNINIETVDPTDTENEQRPSQVGPGEMAWFLFRLYAVFKFIWSFVFTALYFVHFLIKKSQSCDKRIYKFSIAFAIVFAIQAIASLILIVYLPHSITRYTNVVRRRVVISNRAWKTFTFSFIAEIIMVIIGSILIFDKDPQCSLEKDIAYLNITKVIIVIVICVYTLICFPLFLLPCACTFKLLPEYKGISDKVLKRFNSILYNPTEEVDEEEAPSCSICMENYQPGTRIKRLPCNHEFHPDCIVQWLETNNSCPICRQTFK